MRRYLAMMLTLVLGACSGPSVQDLVASENVDALVAKVKEGGKDGAAAAKGLLTLGKGEILAMALREMEASRRGPVLSTIVPMVTRKLATPSAPVDLKDFAVQILPLMEGKDARTVAMAVLRWFAVDPERRASLGTAQFPAVIDALWPHLDDSGRRTAMEAVAKWVVHDPAGRSSFALTYYKKAHPKKGKPRDEDKARYETFRKALISVLEKEISPTVPPKRLRALAALYLSYANKEEIARLGAKLLAELKKGKKVSSTVPIGLLGDLKPKGGVRYLVRLLRAKNPLDVRMAAVRALGGYVDDPDATAHLLEAVLPVMKALVGRGSLDPVSIKLAYEAIRWFDVTRACPAKVPSVKAAEGVLTRTFPPKMRSLASDMRIVATFMVVCAKKEKGLRWVLRRLGDAPSLDALTVVARAVAGLPKDERRSIVSRLVGSSKAVDAALGILVAGMRPKDGLEPVSALRDDGRRIEGWSITIGQLARQVLGASRKKEATDG